MSAELNGVEVVLSGNRILHDVTLTARPGRILALLGPNGCGKTTLLSVLSGDVRARGAVRVCGRPLSAWPPADLARRRAVLSQHDRLTFDMSVRTVVELGRLPHAERASDSAVCATRALAAVHLHDRQDRSWLTLSGGERQRGRLARVSAQLDGVQGGLVLLDEPTNHLDYAHRRALGPWMRTLADRGHAVVVVLHDLDMAARWADDVCVLRDGTVVAAGCTRDALTAEHLSSAFGVPFVAVPLPNGATHWATL